VPHEPRLQRENARKTKSPTGTGRRLQKKRPPSRRQLVKLIDGVTESVQGHPRPRKRLRLDAVLVQHAEDEHGIQRKAFAKTLVALNHLRETITPRPATVLRQAERAAQNFFRKGNLIALRRTAEHVENDVRGWRIEQSGRGGEAGRPWAIAAGIPSRHSR
jgi:hypothetical protein